MKKNPLFSKGIGIWASGMLVGASVVDIVSVGKPAWHPAVLLVLGLVIGYVFLAGFYKAGHSAQAQ